VSDLSCAALQWGIDKEFYPNGTWTIIYDMGATSVGAALVRYSSYEAGRLLGTITQLDAKSPPPPPPYTLRVCLSIHPEGKSYSDLIRVLALNVDPRSGSVCCFVPCGSDVLHAWDK
jgi:hypothetical protein